MTGDDDGKLRIYKAASGEFVGVFPFTDSASESGLPSEEQRDGTEFDSPTPSLKDSQNDDSISQSTGQAVRCLISISSDQVVSGNSDGTVRLYSRRLGREMATFIPEFDNVAAVTCLAFDPKRQSIITGFANGAIKILNTDQKSKVNEFVGHNGCILALAVHNAGDILISSSTDNSIRLWDFNTGQQLYGFKFFAQALFYDELRDTLFCGTNEGVVASAKIVRNSTNQRNAEIKILKKNLVHRASIYSIWYSTQHDVLATVAVDNSASYWPNITGTPYDEAFAKAQQAREAEEGLDTEAVQRLLGELKISSDVTQRASPAATTEAKMIDLCLKVIEDGSDESENRRRNIKENFEKMVLELQHMLEEAGTELEEKRDQLAKRFSHVLDAKEGEKILEDKILRRQEEIRARHEREWSEFRTQSEQERKAFSQNLPKLQSGVASQFLSLKRKCFDVQNEIEAEFSRTLRKNLADSLPVINNVYQIGAPISTNTTSVFKGLDLNSLELVAIKAFPSAVSLDASLRHETLVPIVDVCHAGSTVFVVMKMMKENLSEFVRKRGQLEPSVIAQITYTLLKCLAYLHANRMVFRDLRPQHVLLGEDEQPRLMHLGVMRSLMGTPESEPPEDGRIYAAPELFGRVVKGSSDIWSLGCVFMYLLQTPQEREIPVFYGEDEREILYNMIQIVGKPTTRELQEMGKDCKMGEDGIELLQFVDQQEYEENRPSAPFKELCTKASPLALDLLSKMLVFTTNGRVSAVEALHHPYFQEFGLVPSQSEADLNPHTDLTSTFSEYSDDDEEERDQPSFSSITEERA
eukprot:TRINITY_DN4762_c2_g1_i2.p1 TRINITY_DN4762_c2_g1~~TRINITY_DN4762_c2_g1_i2.p1  ORF type:complete len:949 (-),score=249.84 TRINITY_DN4762_c2_g1_i2:33-2459(-)